MALRRTVDPVPRTASDLFMVSLGTGAWSEPLNYGSGGILGRPWPRTSGEALIEAMLGGSSDFANEAAHLLLNGYSETAPPARLAGRRRGAGLVGAQPATGERRRRPATVALPAGPPRTVGARRRQQAARA